MTKKMLSLLKRTVAILKNKTINLTPSERGEIIEVPQLRLFIDGEWEIAEKDMFLPNGWNLLDYPAIFENGEFDIRDDGKTC
ncbi:MAG: hypothetical protein L6V95_13030 [Candidatus Melainabacteria bacterium]|nr:MAG: hypothetical protein L6V95_13030 [Candidatus Melainabacteria bacterium]